MNTNDVILTEEVGGGATDTINLPSARPVEAPVESDGRVERSHLQQIIIEAVDESNPERPYAMTRIIQAGMSLNRTLYPADVLAAAAHKYSKAKMMLDHPDFWGIGYSVRNLAGVYGEARWDKQQQGVVAPLYFLTRTEAGRLALDLAREEAALRKEGVLSDEDILTGISHVAFVDGKFVASDDGDNDFGYDYFEAEEIHEVLSGDLVVFPAARGEFLELLEGVYQKFAQREGVPLAPRRGVVAERRAPRRIRVDILQ